jgi:hypothetical protein
MAIVAGDIPSLPLWRHLSFTMPFSSLQNSWGV